MTVPVPTTDQLLDIAQTMGFQICPEHLGDEADPEYTIRLLTTILTMTQVHLSAAMGSAAKVGAMSLYHSQSLLDEVFHNVGAQAGLVECDGPEHRLPHCCDVIRTGGNT